jgi:hypothetical protein
MTLDTSRIRLAPADEKIVLARAKGDTLYTVSIVLPPPPTPPTPKTLQIKVVELEKLGYAGWLSGVRKDQWHGRPCSAGYHLLQCTVTLKSGGGNCSVVGQSSVESKNCFCEIHYGADVGSGVDCERLIVEQEDAPPPYQPPPPPTCGSG